MSSTIRSFDGSSIDGVRSRLSGVFAAFDWERLVLPPIGGPILQKAKASANDRLSAFPEDARNRLTEKLGHYSDVQSLNCEDTVTWSVFCTAEQEGWLNDMLTELFGPANRPHSWHLAFWKRIPHPRTGQLLNGPESDVVIESAAWRYVIEAKWKSDISIHKHGETQLEMRAAQASAGTPAGQWGVIVIALDPARYISSGDSAPVFREHFVPDGDCYVQRDRANELNAKAITWERLEEIIGDRGRPGVRAYLDWRLNNI